MPRKESLEEMKKKSERLKKQQKALDKAIKEREEKENLQRALHHEKILQSIWGNRNVGKELNDSNLKQAFLMGAMLFEKFNSIEEINGEEMFQSQIRVLEHLVNREDFPNYLRNRTFEAFSSRE